MGFDLEGAAWRPPSFGYVSATSFMALKRLSSVWSVTPAPLLFAAVLVIGGCGERMSNRRAAHSENRLVWALPFQITSLDPAITSEGRAFDVLRQIHEGLVGIDANGAVVPALAERWEISGDRRTYAFHLRRAAFSDGRPITSGDVIASFRRACLPQTRSPLAADYLGDIEGVEAVSKGKAEQISGLRAVDAGTLEVRLRAPRRSFLSKLAYPVCAVVGPEGAGAGAFVVGSFGPTELRLAANPRYWGGAPALSKIWIRFVVDPTTRANLFRSGEVDLTTVAAADVPGIRREPSLRERLRVTPRADIAYLQLNSTALPALSDARVRQALALSIDRRKIAAEQMAGLPIPAATLIPPGVPGHEDAQVPAADPDAARRLLAEAGYPGGRGFPALEVVYQDAQRDNPVVEAIVTAWRRDLGIPATGRGMPAPSLREANQAHRLPCFLTAWVGDYPDPDDYPSMLLSSASASNGSSYRNPQVDGLLKQADAAPTEGLAAPLYRQAEALALREAPIVPLYFLSDSELVSARVRGLVSSPFGHLSLARVTLAP